MKIVILFLPLLVGVYGNIGYINRGVTRSIYPDQRYAPYVARYLRSRYGLNVYAGRIPRHYYSRTTTGIGMMDGGSSGPFTGGLDGSFPLSMGMRGFSSRSDPLGGISGLAGPSSSPGSPGFSSNDGDTDGGIGPNGPNDGIGLNDLGDGGRGPSSSRGGMGPFDTLGGMDLSGFGDRGISLGSSNGRFGLSGFSDGGIGSGSPSDRNGLSGFSTGGMSSGMFGDGMDLSDYSYTGLGPFSDGMGFGGGRTGIDLYDYGRDKSGGMYYNGFRGMGSDGFGARGMGSGGGAFSSMYDNDGHTGTYYGPTMSFSRGYRSYPFGSLFRGGSMRTSLTGSRAYF